MLNGGGKGAEVTIRALKDLAKSSSRMAVHVMPKKQSQAGADGSGFQSSVAIRLLWEGTQKALEELGMDRGDLVSLCNIIVRLADHSVLHIEARVPHPESNQGVEQIRHYRELASNLLRWASTPAREPDWREVSEKLRSEGAPALE
jgi:hypothetical protein